MARKSKYAAMFTLRKDGRYQGSYTDENGRHFVYDRDPEKLFQKIQQKLNETIPVVTFREIEAAWEQTHRKEIGEKTWNNYVPHIRDILDKYGDMPISDIEAADVSADLARAKVKGYSATIVNTRRSLFRMIFDRAILDGHIKYNPVSSVKLPKGLKRGKRSAPTKEQMQIILSNVDAPFGLFPFFLLCTGMRKSEALALDWKDIDLKNREIHVTKTLTYISSSKPKLKPPKTDAGTRIVPIIDILAKELHPKSGLVFPYPPGNRGGAVGGYMTEHSYKGAWYRYCRHVGLMDGDKPALTAHNLRHGTATLLFENGVDELTTQKILGHSRIGITREIYTDLRNEQRKKSVSKFNEGMSKLMSDKL